MGFKSAFLKVVFQVVLYGDVDANPKNHLIQIHDIKTEDEILKYLYDFRRYFDIIIFHSFGSLPVVLSFK